MQLQGAHGQGFSFRRQRCQRFETGLSSRQPISRSTANQGASSSGSNASDAQPQLAAQPLEATQVSAEALRMVEESSQQQQQAMTKRLLAVGAVSLAVAAASIPALKGTNDFAALKAQAMPFDEAMRNGKPTLLQFYADWCKQCKAMAPIVTDLAKQYSGNLNLVILNVDNPKWMAEASRYEVQSIPEFVFLDPQKEVQGIFVGPVPKGVLADNVGALARGSTMPFKVMRSAATSIEGREEMVESKGTAGPMDHGVKRGSA